MTETSSADRSSRTGERRVNGGMPGAVERLAQLRSVLPLLAKDAAVERRRASALEADNARLQRRVAELEEALRRARDAGCSVPGSVAPRASTDER